MRILLATIILALALTITGCTAPEPTPAPTVAPAAAVVPTPTLTATPTDTPTPQPTPTATKPPPTATPAPLPTNTPAPTYTPQPTPTATAIPTPTRTPQPTNTPLPTSTPTPLSPIFHLQHGSWLEQNNPVRANRLKALPWVAHDMDASERRAVNELLTAARWHPDTFDALLGLPWLADGITRDETETIRSIRTAARVAPALADQMLQKPWVQDDITGDEAAVLDWLDRLARRVDGPARAEIIKETIAIADMPFLDSVESWDPLALTSLHWIAGRDIDGFWEIIRHPKIVDGITDDEAKLITVFGRRTYLTGPGSAQVLLGDSADVEERIIELPHTGEVLLAIIRTRHQRTPSMDYLEHAIRTIEEFMAAPLPVRYAALLYYPTTDSTANNNFTHLMMAAQDDEVGGPHWDNNPSVMAHEVAHWYWYRYGDVYQRWISEGNADFLRIISEHERVQRPIEPIKSPCPYFNNISEMEKSDPEQLDQRRTCDYSTGQRLFLDLYLTLGESTFLPAYRALYQKSQQDDPADDCEGVALTLCHVLSAFKSGATPDIAATVDQIIARWYGPLP